MNYEDYKVGNKMFFNYNEAYDYFINSSETQMWGGTIKGNYEVIHDKNYPF